MFTLWYHHRFADSDEVAVFDDFAALVAAALKLGKGKKLVPLSHTHVPLAMGLGKPVLAWQLPSGDIIIGTKE